jgi:predicted acyl esterase
MLMTEPDARLGDRPVGDTGFPYDDIVTAWFDRFLRDEPGEWRPMPKVQVFLMGAATWLTGESWPLPDTVAQSLFLTSAEAANTIWGDGTLVPAAGDALADELIADPSNPVPSMGGGLGSDYPVCMDQRDVECRADVLVYSTPVLTEPVSIVGDVSAELYIEADVDDADIFLKLVDVYPGITTANYFPAGHQIRIEIAGSNFPLGDRNWHTGERNDLASDGPIAHITLHHGAGHESALHFRAYTGDVAINTPMASLRDGDRL